MSNINSLIETQEFATLPPVAARILNLLEEDNIDIRDIAKLIETDASLTLKLLRVANSPLYASRTEVNSIHQAIITLGLNRLTNIVLGVSIFSRFLLSSNKQIADLMEKFWWHSSCTGIVAKALAGKINKQFKELEFIGGLLHDIGKLAMLQFDSTKYLEVIELINNKGMIDTEAETQIFGVHHLEVGEHIAKLWKLPNDLVSIIGYHSSLDKLNKSQDVVAVVRFADLLCEIWGAHIYEGLNLVRFAEEESWKILCKLVPELDNMDVEIFTFELESEFKKSADFLSAISK
jgi:putative nucleotidyltransferase with HDIG domain